jgi:hypothetical protein
MLLPILHQEKKSLKNCLGWGEYWHAQAQISTTEVSGLCNGRVHLHTPETSVVIKFWNHRHLNLYFYIYIIFHCNNTSEIKLVYVALGWHDFVIAKVNSEIKILHDFVTPFHLFHFLTFFSSKLFALLTKIIIIVIKEN